MNIKEAKLEIIRTIRAYNRKNDAGLYEIPPVRQRPILLMGPPGIGKTAIMEQIARECGIGLVSYTITHHTRQSAIGLPMIAHRRYGDQEYAVTEYTMSEIIASVYDKIEASGIREGILFLDEINCVSETLYPTMLQFLQYKTFGTHHMPDGWIIVTAGNPVQYNRSAREFDIVTLDRVKKMDIEADLGVWKEYAQKADVHRSILSYLELRPQNFFIFRTELSGRNFVTARGWEDLSRMLASYENMGEPVTEQLAVQYLQDPETAGDFVLYYDLYRKYREMYHVEQILDGHSFTDPAALRGIPFDEKLSLIRLLSDSLHNEFVRYHENRSVQEILYRQLLHFRERNDEAGTSAPSEILSSLIEEMRTDQKKRADAGLLGREELKNSSLALKALDEVQILIREKGSQEDPSDGKEKPFLLVKEWFGLREEKREREAESTDLHLTNAFSFLHRVYGTGQEIVMLLTALNTDWYFLRFMEDGQNEAYEKYNQLLLLADRRENIRRKILELL